MLLLRLFPHVPGGGRPFFFPGRSVAGAFLNKGFRLSQTFHAGAGSLKFPFSLNPGEMMNKTSINSTVLLINSVTKLFL